MRLNHIHFASPAWKETQSFYESYFGFHLSRALGKTRVLVNDEHFLLAIDEAAEALPGAARFHFGFGLEGPERVEEVFRKMKGDGVLIEGELKRLSENAIQFYCFDPAGNRVEVGWYKTL